MESEVLKEKIHTEPMLNDPRYITLLSLVVLIVTLCKYTSRLIYDFWTLMQMNVKDTS